jgi:hypothetical protein
VIAIAACVVLAITVVAAREVQSARQVHGGGQGQSVEPPATEKAAGSYKVTVSVAVAGKVTGGIGDQLIGLSFESSTVNNGYRYDNVGNLPQLLRNLGSSVIRFGGNTADMSFTGIDSAQLAGLARLAKATGWSVLYTENLGTFNAAQVTADASAVSAALGSGLFAFACGNEPDQFATARLRPSGYTFGEYLAQEAECFQAIRRGAPHAPLEGPDIAWSQAWLAEYAVKEAGTISSLGAHYYPLGCAGPGDKPAALVATLLSPALAGREAATFAKYVGTSEYRPQPIYYGMLFTHLLGTGGFLPVKVSRSSPAGNIAAFALKPGHGDGLRLMVENLSKDQAKATLRVGGYRGAASVLRLTGPSPLATSGVQIQGASAAANGTVTPDGPGAVTCTSGGCPVTIGPYSAVLVTLG